MLFQEGEFLIASLAFIWLLFFFCTEVLPLYLLIKLGKGTHCFVNPSECIVGVGGTPDLSWRKIFSRFCLHSSKMLGENFGHFYLELP